MGIEFTKDERKAIYRKARLLLKGLLIAVAVMTLFGWFPWPAVALAFTWVVVLLALWVVAHHVIEWVENNS